MQLTVNCVFVCYEGQGHYSTAHQGMVGADQQSQRRGTGDEGRSRHAAVRAPQEAAGHRPGAADCAAQTHPRTVGGETHTVHTLRLFNHLFASTRAA